MLLTLYGTGIRISEALYLTLKDVNLLDSLITVRNSKFFKSRIVPTGPMLTKTLEAYASKRRHLPLPAGKDSAFFVTRTGNGLCYELESIYEEALCVELDENRIKYQRQLSVPIIYKQRSLGEHRLDLLIEDEIIVEMKAVYKIEPVFEAQLLSYLKMTGKKIGLLINFNVPVFSKRH